jgi:hypothetical protein
MGFPIDRRTERDFEAGWQGEVVTCDIDRTYLMTRFSSLRGLARIPFEFAIDKLDIEGMVPLLKELRRGPARTSRSTPLYFISASPGQLRSVIERKMLLDGLEFDGTTFKDWLGVVAGLRLRRLKEQLGFKLTALSAARRELPAAAREILIGDDLETDALAYTIYADALAGRLTGEQLSHLLLRHGVSFEDAESIGAALRALPACGGVRRIYIRLERNDRPEAFLDSFPWLCACRGAFQIAVSLWAQGSISRQGVTRVADDLASRGMEPPVLADRLAECCRRALCDRPAAEELAEELAAAKQVPRGIELPEAEPVWAEARERAAGNPDLPWTPARQL